MAFDWKKLEDAVFAWVHDASGLETSAIFFSQQDVNAPGGPYLTIKIGDPVRVGGHDGFTEAFDESDGMVVLTTIGPREVTIQVAAYGCPTNGNDSARAVVGKLQDSLGLPSVRQTLIDAGLGVLEEGTVQDLSAIFGTDFEGRAVLEVLGLINATAEERSGYIHSVQLVNEVDVPPRDSTTVVVTGPTET